MFYLVFVENSPDSPEMASENQSVHELFKEFIGEKSLPGHGEVAKLNLSSKQLSGPIPESKNSSTK